jgi:hypothetical protein
MVALIYLPVRHRVAVRWRPVHHPSIRPSAATFVRAALARAPLRSSDPPACFLAASFSVSLPLHARPHPTSRLPAACSTGEQRGALVCVCLGRCSGGGRHGGRSGPKQSDSDSAATRRLGIRGERGPRCACEGDGEWTDARPTRTSEPRHSQQLSFRNRRAQSLPGACCSLCAANQLIAASLPASCRCPCRPASAIRRWRMR